jgi:hypothetical protein
MLAKDTFLDQIITNQYRAIRYYKLFAAGLLTIGVVVIIVSILFAGQLISDVFKGLFSIGGAFVSSLSAFQLKEIIARREKVDTLTTIKNLLIQQAIAEDKGMDDDMNNRIDQLIWQVVEKTTIG